MGMRFAGEGGRRGGALFIGEGDILSGEGDILLGEQSS
jgi:hypothetical protein